MADAGASIWVPLVLAAVSAGGSAYASSEQSRQSEIARNEAVENQKAAEARQKAYNEEVAAANQKAYQENAYPTAQEIEAQRAVGLKTLGNDRIARLEQLARTSSVRGMGSGSGALAGGGGAIESAYLEGLSNLSSNLSKLANTPKAGFTFPYEANIGASSGMYPASSSAYTATGSSPLMSALGYMAGSGGGLSNLFSNNTAANVVPLDEYTPFSMANLGY